jgi:hypothetical protein
MSIEDERVAGVMKVGVLRDSETAFPYTEGNPRLVLESQEHLGTDLGLGSDKGRTFAWDKQSKSHSGKADSLPWWNPVF